MKHWSNHLNRILAMALAAAAAAVWAYANSVTYTGQGLLANGDGSYVVQDELCGVENGADREGAYLLWVLTATGASNADITGPWGTASMTKTGNGTFKYISDWYNPSMLLPPPVTDTVTATYDGRPRNAQLVISHGCAPKQDGAWCSPGYWLNTLNKSPTNGWTTIGVTPPGPLYTDVISSPTPSSGTPTLLDVLQNKQLYFASQDQGAAFNAVGAYLTDLIPGYQFDPALVGTSDACPLDAFGNFK